VHGRLEFLVALPVAVRLLHHDAALEEEALEDLADVELRVLRFANAERDVLEVAEDGHVLRVGGSGHLVGSVQQVPRRALIGSRIGVIIPNMGTERHDPGEALFTKTQRRILGLLFGTPERSFYANEIVRSAGVGIGAALRELDRLAASGLVVSARIGNQKHFQANRTGSYSKSYSGIARKILGPSLARRRALGHLAVPVAHEPAAAYEVTPDSSGKCLARCSRGCAQIWHPQAEPFSARRREKR